jgi:competence protein ComEC
MVWRLLKNNLINLQLIYMKKTLLVFSLAFCWAAAFAESIQIHHIGIGQGDATLIIITNDAGEKATILIDAGNSTGKGTAVAGAIETDMVTITTKRLDLVIVSHLHSDHLGGIQTAMATLLASGWTIGAVVDRSAVYASTSDVVCYDGNEQDKYMDNDPEGPVPTATLVSKYRTYVEGLDTKGTITGWYNVNTGDNIMKLIPSFKCKTTLLTLTGNAIVCDGSDASGNCVHALNYINYVKNENDYSYAFLLQLGSFKYFTGGDIGGEAPYVNLETPMVSYFQSRPDAAKFHFCGYKASHHGSEHSTNSTFISYTKPTVTVVPSALRSFSKTQLPSAGTLSRIQGSSSNSNIFYTYVSASPSSGTVTNYKDVIFKVDDAGFESDHKIAVTTFERNKQSLAFMFGTSTDTTIVCNKH